MWKTAPARAVIRFCRNGFAAIGLILTVYLPCFEMAVVTSNSMSPTLRGDGKAGSDQFLCERITYGIRPPRRWEIVYFRNDEGLLVAKRVVGLPGETVSLNDHVLLINGRPVVRPDSLKDIKYYAYGNLAAGHWAECRDRFYVLGDDSVDSADSRYIGAVPLSAIRSRPWITVWPFSRMRLLNP